MYADLHMHSYFSDGTNSPSELVQLAKNNKVSVISLTDHDTIEGLNEAIREGEKHKVRVIPGVEISTSAEGLRIHILGYKFDQSNQPLKNYLQEMSQARTQNTKDIFDRNIKFGFLQYSWERVLEHNLGKSWLTGLHVFDSLVKDGIYKSNQWEEFKFKCYGKESPAYLSLDGFTAKSAIEIILTAGGFPVVAHPKLIGDDSQIKKLISYGLQGIEAYYPIHTEKETKKYLNLAKDNNLLVTGGSDWHGDFTEWDVELGGCGISESLVKALLETRQGDVSSVL